MTTFQTLQILKTNKMYFRFLRSIFVSDLYSCLTESQAHNKIRKHTEKDQFIYAYLFCGIKEFEQFKEHKT